jgi:hypothetical protein
LYRFLSLFHKLNRDKEAPSVKVITTKEQGANLVIFPYQLKNGKISFVLIITVDTESKTNIIVKKNGIFI